MKSQDIGLLLKLVALQNFESIESHDNKAMAMLPDDWRDWEPDASSEQHDEHYVYRDSEARYQERFSVRALAQETGISKSQVSLSLQRCKYVGLVRRDRRLGIPRTNTRALFNFIVHGLRYVFPARPGEITRGIATSFGAPVLEGKLISAGELLMVWPDARGNTRGQAIKPLFKSVPHAVRRDPTLYAMLALVDAIRIGQPRESLLAAKMLAEQLEVSP